MCMHTIINESELSQENFTLPDLIHFVVLKYGCMLNLTHLKVLY